MPPIRFSYISRDGQQITAYRWDPPGAPVAAVQVTHGMGEHALRYDHVAGALNRTGLVVYAQDHRGHGATASPDALGDLGEGGWPALVADIGLLAMFNAPFEPARTPFDWLSRDEAIVDAYIADPRCGFGIDTSSAQAMFAGARRLADPGQVSAMRPDLPVYIAAGEHDPVHGALTLLDPLADRYRSAGLSDVTVRVYPGARHEILNETNNGEVISDLAEWVERVVAG